MFFWKISTSKFSKHDIANFIKKTNFDDKLKKLNRNVIANKIKHLLVKKKKTNCQKKEKDLQKIW